MESTHASLKSSHQAKNDLTTIIHGVRNALLQPYEVWSHTYNMTEEIPSRNVRIFHRRMVQIGP